jgi:tetratricopeptide (TPR) repeat protein
LPITAGLQQRLNKARPIVPQAYEAWVLARRERNRFTGESLRNCVRLDSTAVRLDPEYAPAYALMADCYNQLANLGEGVPAEFYKQAKAAAGKALSIDDDVAAGHFALAWALANSDWDWAGAEQEYLHGLLLDPSSSLGHAQYGWFLSWLGEHERAVAELSRAQEINPVSLSEIGMMSAVYWVGRRYDEAVREASRAITLDSTFGWAHARLANAYAAMGAYPQAVVAAEKAFALSPRTALIRVRLARMYALAGQKQQALNLLRETQEVERLQAEVALVYLALGDRDAAIGSLREAAARRDGNLVLLKVNSEWDPLREDPRFKDLLKRMAFPD